MGGKTSPDQIRRGADLTGTDLAVIANDMRVVMSFLMRHGVCKAEQERQLARSLEARLGRRPLVIAPVTGLRATSSCHANLLAWAREVRDGDTASDEVLIRACRTLLEHSPDQAERARAQDLLHLMEAS